MLIGSTSIVVKESRVCLSATMEVVRAMKIEVVMRILRDKDGDQFPAGDPGSVSFNRGDSGRYSVRFCNISDDLANHFMGRRAHDEDHSLGLFIDCFPSNPVCRIAF